MSNHAYRMQADGGSTLSRVGIFFQKDVFIVAPEHPQRTILRKDEGQRTWARFAKAKC